MLSSKQMQPHHKGGRGGTNTCKTEGSSAHRAARLCSRTRSSIEETKLQSVRATVVLECLRRVNKGALIIKRTFENGGISD